jgi:hypothetical protein
MMPTPDTSYDDAMKIVCGIVQSQMAWPSPRMLAQDLQSALRLLPDETVYRDNPIGDVMREFVGWLSADIAELHAVEVPLLADSLERFLLLKYRDRTCSKCGAAMTYTATAPIANAPMEWRCFACPVDLGNASTNTGVDR